MSTTSITRKDPKNGIVSAAKAAKTAIQKTSDKAEKTAKKTAVSAGKIVKDATIRAELAVADAGGVIFAKKKSSMMSDGSDRTPTTSLNEKSNSTPSDISAASETTNKAKDLEKSQNKDDLQCTCSREPSAWTATTKTNAPEANQTPCSPRICDSNFKTLLQDPMSLIVLFLALLAQVVSIRSYRLILNNQVPLYVSWLWALVSFFLGRELSRQKTRKEMIEKLKLNDQSFTKSEMKASNSFARDQDSTEHLDKLDNRDMKIKEERVRFRRIQTMMDKLKINSGEKHFWTTLSGGSNRKRKPWEVFGNVLVSRSLTESLMPRSPDRQRTSLATMGVSMQEIQRAIEEDQSRFLGTYADDMEKLRASSLEEDCINPLFRLRGLDVFLTDSPESDCGTHSFLIENGLRDRPTFLINGITQWANILIYFEMPGWITDWRHFEEDENDGEDLIALKRFLNGDDEYRNKRFKTVAVLVDGPMPIKYISPKEKSSATIVGANAKGSWKKHPPTIDEITGETKLYPCMEFECDMMSNATIRSVTSVFKRYLRTVVGDAAILIEKPWGQEKDEPTAILGMCRFDRIDVRDCPDLPPRMELGDTEEQRDLVKASILLGKEKPIFT